MTDEQMREFRRCTLMGVWPNRCKTGLMCRICGTELETYYCEERVYLVRCMGCKKITLVGAKNPGEAGEIAGGR